MYHPQTDDLVGHYTDLTSAELSLSLKLTGGSIDSSLFMDTQLGSGESDLFPIISLELSGAINTLQEARLRAQELH